MTPDERLDKSAFQINYSSWKGPRQTIFFAQSDDLLHWIKCGPKHEFVQDELEGELTLPRSLGAPRGLYVEHACNAGTAVLFQSSGRAELGPVRADGAGFKPESMPDRETTFKSPARFRLVLKSELMEIYLDDFLIECFSLPAPATGRIGLIRGDDSASIGTWKTWIENTPGA